MHALRSLYGIGIADVPLEVPREKTPEPQPAVAAPKPQPRTTASRPLTVGILRDAKAAGNTQRVPITERVKEPEVPARERLKKKTIAFGVTTNVSQTVEREKDPQQPRPSTRPSTRPPSFPPPPPPMAATLGRTGVGASRPAAAEAARAATRQHTSSIPPAETGGDQAGDENKPPGSVDGREMEELRARVLELEKQAAEGRKRERERERVVVDCEKHISKLVEMLSTLTRRFQEFKERMEGKGDSDEEVAPPRRPHRRQEHSDEEARRERGGGTAAAPRRHTTTPHRLLSDEETRRALERQLSMNPLLMRQLQDAIDEDTYERDYGGNRGAREKSAPPAPNARRAYFDEYDEPPRAAAPAANKRWSEEPRGRLGRATPPGREDRGGRGGGTRRRTETTPSRRRVTERVTMERVHHFDESDESDPGYRQRYSSDEQPYTVYNEEIVDDYTSVAQADNRRGHGAYRGDHPVITEVSDSEDSLERKRRELREKKEARARHR